MEFPNNLAALMKQRAVTSYRLAKEVGVRTSTVTGWLTGRSPQLAHLKKIADYFGVSIESLTCGPRENSGQASAQPDVGQDVGVLLDSILDKLDTEDTLMLNGSYLSPQAQELLRESIESNVRLAERLSRRQREG